MIEKTQKTLYGWNARLIFEEHASLHTMNRSKRLIVNINSVTIFSDYEKACLICKLKLSLK